MPWGDARVQMQWGMSCGCSGDAVRGCAGANAVGDELRMRQGMHCGDAQVQMQWRMSCGCGWDALGGCAGADAMGDELRMRQGMH